MSVTDCGRFDDKMDGETSRWGREKRQPCVECVGIEMKVLDSTVVSLLASGGREK